MLLTAGERKSMALLCMALAELGIEASSFTGSQAGIVTDTTHGKAKILEVKGDRLRTAIAARQIPVVAGFQGVSTANDVTTLGRGGSDTTAVALAAAFGADACEIYTDVTGVFTADPRIVPNARRLSRVSFDEMLEMAATGGRVLALRSVEFARNHHVPLHVRSSFTWEPGTWITEEDASMEAPIISGVTHDTSEAKVTITGVPDKPGIAARLFRALADESVNVDMIVQNTSIGGATDISFTVPKSDLVASERVTGELVAEIGAERRHPRRGHRPGLADRSRHEDQPGRCRDDVRGAGEHRRQHRDDLDIVDSHQLRRCRRRRRSVGTSAAHRVLARRLRRRNCGVAREGRR